MIIGKKNSKKKRKEGLVFWFNRCLIKTREDHVRWNDEPIQWGHQSQWMETVVLHKIEDTIYYYVSRRSDLTHPFGWIYWVKRPLGVCAAAKQKLKPKTPHLPRHAHHIFAYPWCQLPSKKIFYRLKKVNIL